MQPEFIIFQILILIFSVVIHEVSHGYVAQMLGDPTARLAGRLTLNPLKHLDPLGSVILPGILLLTNAGFLIGWAKPVPYNPYNLSNQKWGEAWVAGAGPLVNIALAVLFGFIIRIGLSLDMLDTSSPFLQIASFVVLINIVLAIFNMIPIPPLDGSKVFAALLPYRLAFKYQQLQGWIMQYGFIGGLIFLLIFIYFLWPIFRSLIFFIFSVLTGIGA